MQEYKNSKKVPFPLLIEKAIEHANADRTDKNFVLSNIFMEVAKV
ncbi:MAG: hypothetical protein APG12_00650 [Candidatus Methanofastidiosum methylothiophilum]|uniref:Uncharacterized protein n=1 Tax=Candidatus Methanofastidiosum methylothiophilum TaxID=1705564 RepID=A0A150ITD5_9EURY|nr:MAG: hypothetical protein APG10_00051 [Candidatus Methanofastidiosum methylthiophilus]KYC48135.1 MAG: hypothetical protein APG11_00603 [Candidatus Methanofastidiosum methylthiophilus]KYC50626.1 MAG: hypothetical protein APG12_00650 [Candidatus Methanofastidiosum methylthiophilus]